MHLDPRIDVLHRRRAQVEQAGRRGAHEHDPVLQDLAIDLAVDDVGGRHVGEAALRAEIGHQHGAVAVHRDPAIADTHGLDGVIAVALAGDLDLDVRPAERGARRAQRQHLVEAAIVTLYQRHAPEQAVVAHQGVVEEATARGGLLQDGQVRAVALRARQRQRFRPGRIDGAERGREAADGGVLAVLDALAEEVSQHRVAVLEGAREHRVVLKLRCEPFQLLAESRVVRQRPVGQSLQDLQPRALVVFGEDHVEAHGAHAVVVEQLIDDACDRVARPGPAAELAQAALVDVDDDDALVDGARERQVQTRVIGDVLELLDEAESHRAGRVQQEGYGQQHAERESNRSLLEQKGKQCCDPLDGPGGGPAPR